MLVCICPVLPASGHLVNISYSSLKTHLRNQNSTLTNQRIVHELITYPGMPLPRLVFKNGLLALVTIART